MTGSSVIETKVYHLYAWCGWRKCSVNSTVLTSSHLPSPSLSWIERGRERGKNMSQCNGPQFSPCWLWSIYPWNVTSCHDHSFPWCENMCLTRSGMLAGWENAILETHLDPCCQRCSISNRYPEKKNIKRNKDIFVHFVEFPCILNAATWRCTPLKFTRENANLFFFLNLRVYEIWLYYWRMLNPRTLLQS